MHLVPSPLHAAVVHFPIVLILLGAVVAVAAIFTTRGHLRWITFALLALGASGAVVAVNTGEADGEAVDRTPAVSALIEAHEEWAERTQAVALIAAGFAVAALATARWRVTARLLSVASAAAAFTAAACVFQTGHRGGQLVYRHGAGVNLVPASGAGGDQAPTAESRPKPRVDDD